MHHANAKRDGVMGAAQAQSFAIDQNLSGVHRMEAVENLHQSAFAGAILAQERVNLARLDRQADIVVRQHAREAFYDVPHFQGMLHRALLSGSFYSRVAMETMGFVARLFRGEAFPRVSQKPPPSTAGLQQLPPLLK